MNKKLKKMLLFLIKGDYVSYLQALHSDGFSGKFDDRMKEIVLERLGDSDTCVNEEKVIREAIRFTANVYGSESGEFFNEQDDKKEPDYID